MAISVVRADVDTDADITSWASVTRASGFDTFATTPSSANLKALVTDETGSGALVFATSPTLVTPALGTPASGVLTNATGYPFSALASIPTTISGYGITDAYTETEANALSPGPNMFLNSGFDYWPEISTVQARNAACTANIASTSISAYTLANTTVCTIADTSLLQDGWLYVFSAAADTYLKISTMRVKSIVTNTSASFTIPLNLVPAASAACTILPYTTGDRGAATGYGPSGWLKTPALYMWADRNSANVHRGAWCSIALEKTASGAQDFYYQVPTAELPTFAGRDIVVNMAVQHKIKGSTGAPRLFIQVNGGARVYGNACSTTGSFESLQQTASISSSLTSLAIGLELPATTMPSGDVCHVSHPFLGMGTAVPSFFYTRDATEQIRGVGHCVPAFWNGGSVTFPSVADAAGTYSFEFDAYQETNGRISPRVREIDVVIEGQNTDVDEALSWKSSVSSPTLYGPRLISKVTTKLEVAHRAIYFDTSGIARVYTETSGGAWGTLSMDINSVIAE